MTTTRFVSAFVVALGMTVTAVAAEPAWLVQARAREGKPMKEVRIRSEDREFEAQVPAKVLTRKLLRRQDTYSLSLDIGSDSPLDCELNPDGIDLANAHLHMANATFPELEKIQGKIQNKAVESTDIGVIDGIPYIAVTWIYSADDGKGPKLGMLKQLTAQKGEMSFYCLHADIGYEKTFKKVLHSLLSTLNYKTGAPKPHYSEVALLEFGGKTIGVARLSMTRDADGDVKEETSSSTAMISDDGGLQADDEFDIEWSRPDGTMINAVSVSSENGELATNLKLIREESEWKVTGPFQGKEVSLSLGQEDPETNLAHMRYLKEQMAKGKEAENSEVECTRWIASADPSRFVKVKTSIGRDTGNGQFTVSESMIGLKMDMLIDKATGSASLATVEIGPAQMKIRRVHSSGAP